MADEFNIQSLPFYWLIPTVIIAVAFGIVGYLIAKRRIKQPMAMFLVRFGIVFFLLFFLEVVILNVAPSFHSTMQNLVARLVGGDTDLSGG